MKMFVRAAVVLLCLVSAFSVPAQSRPDPEYRSYLAHIAAASQALRLFDTAEAKRWLASAPVKHRGWEWHYLNTRADESSATFKYADPVTAIAVSPDGKLLAASSGRTIGLFDLKTLKELRVFSGHDEQINGVAFSPDGKRLASASSDQTVRLWDTLTGESIMTLSYGTQVWGVQFTPDGKRLAVLPIGDSVMILEANEGRNRER